MFLQKLFSIFKSFDWILLGAVFLLICFGLAAIYSVTISFEEASFLNFNKQIIFAVIGLIVLFIISFFDYRFWQDYSYLVYLAVAIILVAVLFFGTTVRGTTGWFSIFGINFQPVELAKIALIIFLAYFLSNKGALIKEPKNFIITLSGTGLFFLLVMLQPDFGSGVILFLVWLLIVVFSGASKKHLIITGLGLMALAVVAWFFLFADYQKDRILTFVNPTSDPYGSGYHVRQAVTAVGAGGFLGRGLGFGSQSQLKFLPASQTDFIFAVIAEELGFLGVSLVFFLWGLIFWRLIRAVKIMKDNFSALFILGASAIFFSQIIINIGMNIGLVPVTGISLPFLSYGGSFLLISLVLIGIIESMIIRNQRLGA
ncbi:MAG: rod shape-determining protein RodA [Parcubacteria group bacterium]|nr:rod shape-determining protein RodA [Parcubacteria group bacterium]